MTSHSVALEVAAVTTGRQAMACFCLGIPAILEVLAVCHPAAGRGQPCEKCAASQLKVQ